MGLKLNAASLAAIDRALADGSAVDTTRRSASGKLVPAHINRPSARVVSGNGPMRHGVKLVPDPTWVPPVEASWVCVTVPIRTPNPTNGSHGHWSVGAKRAALQREAVALALIGVDDGTRARLAEGCTVTLTRVSAGRLDKSNLPAALKHIEDAVAVWLLGGSPGQLDDDDRIEWERGQLKSKAGVFGVIISVRERPCTSPPATALPFASPRTARPLSSATTDRSSR